MALPVVYCQCHIIPQHNNKEEIHMIRKLLSLVLALAMVCTVFATAAADWDAAE